MRAGSQGGTVPGYDRSRRYPPRGVWFGLVLAATTVRALVAQDALDEATMRRLHDPVALAADRVTHWNGPDGHWIHLWGNVSVLHGPEPVVRAREVVVRISDQSTEFEKIKQVEVYAEGVVRSARDQGQPPAVGRSTVRTGEIRLKCFQPAGPTETKNPPWQLQIIKRSGFLQKKPAIAAPSARASDRDASPIDARLEILTKRAAARAAQAAPPRATVPVIPTQAVVRNQSDDAVPTLLSSGETQSQPDAATARTTQRPAKRDSMVQRAGGSGDRAPVLASSTGTPRTSDPQVQQAQAQQVPPTGTQPPIIDLPPIEGAPEVQVPNITPGPLDRPPDLQPLPEVDGGMMGPPLPDEPRTDANGRPLPELPVVPIFPGTQRLTRIFPRNGHSLDMHALDKTPDGVTIYIVRNGVNIVTQAPRFGTIDIEADSAIIWHGPSPAKGEPYKSPAGDLFVDNEKAPMEIYLEGNVILRQDENKYAGKGDQRTIRAPQLYYDFLTDRMLAPNGEIDMFTPSLMAPVRLSSPRIEQFRTPVMLPNGTMTLSEDPEIRLPSALMTGSRFPNPGYSISSKTIDLTRSTRPLTNPDTGKEEDDPDAPPKKTEEQVWHVDARQNIYWGINLPFFFWPRINEDLDDQQPPLRMIGFNSVNYFGQQLKTDWNGFRLLGMRRPKNVDLWNVDVDYLSLRTKDFPALGSEMGWFGDDLIRDLIDPYHEHRTTDDAHITHNYFGYFDIWGLKDAGIDVLGTGPAVVTNGPIGAGNAGFQRSDDPPFQSDRLRLTLRHNQRFLLEDEDHAFDELRLQVEAGYATDRNFIEEYYKRLFDTGMDQETLAYLTWQHDNRFASIWTEGNTQNWVTDTQWLPRADYYRLGDSFFNNMFSYFNHTGLNYATTHTDIMVNNPNLFAFLPFDPISNTTGTFSAGRFYTNHELDMPINLGNVLRFVPYVQGQAVGWTDQLGAGPLGHLPSGAMGRIWGAAGIRTEFTAYKQYDWVESDLWNVHGLNNKISLFTDSRVAWSNVKLNDVAVQDDLDDNTYEYVRRYLALTSFTGGILPMPYDPRHLILRQTLSPITGTTDVQASIDTVQLGIHQRLQTKRGPLGKRRIVDYMTLDASTTYFPYSQRDNFGTPWGQTMYNWQWYIGDRTSIVSAGWFEFFKLLGSTPLNNNMTTGYNPNGLNIITTGISIARPPRSNVFLGYSIIDTGPIKTSAANVAISYWLSPKWYGTYSTSYDFGDAILLGTAFSFTRIGADYLTTIGLSLDPQRQNAYTFAVQIVPRLGGIRSGSASGSGQFDTRFAPTQ
jgi:hypothetical protein